MFFMLIACGLLIISALVAYWYYLYYTCLGACKVPGPKPIPLVGIALEFTDSASFLPVLENLISKYGRIVKVFLGFEPLILITDYKLLEHTVSSQKYITKSSIGYRFLQNWLGFGLLTSTGQKWKTRRRIITPTYHFSILEQFAEVFDSVSNVLVANLRKESGKGSTDIYPYITLCALDIICETAMGIQINAQTNAESEYVQNVKKMCKIVVDRSFNPIQQFELLYRFTENYQIEKNALKSLHSHTLTMIKNKRKLLQTNTVINEIDEFGVKKRVAFLDLLLKATTSDGKLLSDQDIAEEVDTFMFEGHDTTASAMSFALFSIANHPEVQQKIINEQKFIFGNEKRATTFKDLQDMRYLEMVIKETLRLYPSVPFFGRELIEDMEFNDIKIKKGVQILLFAYGLQRDPEYFPDPTKFDPERFAEDKQIPIYSYLPFSAGPRNCIGQKFAMFEMKSTISKVLRNFELHPVTPKHELQLVAETILKSRNGMFVRVEDRL